MASPQPKLEAQPLTPLTAEFWSTEQENKYRQSIFEESVRKIGSALLFGGGAYLALALIDMLVIGVNQALVYCLITRATALSMMIFAYAMIKKTGTAKAQDFYITFSALILGLSEITLLVIKDQTILHHGITAILVVLSFYLFVPFRYGNMLASCVTISLLFLFASLTFLAPDFHDFLLTGLLICCANLFGILSQHRQNLLDRRHFLNLENLRVEVRERSNAEENLRRNETYLEELFRTAPTPLLVADRESGQIKMGNKAAAELLNVPHKHLSTFCVSEFGIDEKSWNDLALKSRQDEDNEATDLNIRNLHKDALQVSFRTSPITFEGDECILLNATDVTQRRKRTDILRTIAKGFSGKTGVAFLEEMTTFLHETTQCEWAFVGQISEDGKTVHSLSFYDNGKSGSKIAYQLAGTPCEKVIGKDICIFETGVSQLFPKDLPLAQKGAEGYAGVPLFDSQGKLLGLIAVFGTRPLRDTETITYLMQILAGRAAIELEAFQAEEELRKSRERLSVALSAAAEFMYTWDVETDKLEMSHHDKSRFMLENVPQTGSEWIERLHPDDREKVRQAFRDHIRNHTPSVDCGYRLIDDAGETFFLRVHAQAVRNDIGRATWIAGAVVDMTDFQKTKSALEESEERYREMVESAPDTIIVHTNDEIVYANPAAAHLLRVDIPGDLVGEPIHSFIDPAFEKIISKRLETLASGQRRLPALEIRIRQADGEMLDVHAVSQRIVRDGKPMVQSVLRDISARKRAAERLRASEAHHKALFNNAPVGIFLLSKEGKFSQFNENWADMLGYHGPEGRAELLKKSPIEITHPDDRLQSQKRIDEILSGNIHSYRVEKRWLRKDGSVCWGDISVTAVLDAEGGTDMAMVVVQDITERKKMEEELRRHATTDSLTGASNRRHFMDRGEEELHRAQRYQRPLAVLALDLDHFKSINDTYGHKAGDTALQHFSTYCMKALREEDIFGRIGGEEFAVVMPESTLKGAKEAAERIRSSLESNPFKTGGKKVTLSVSIGIAGCPTDLLNCIEIVDGFETLLVQADQALYQAKENGRNRVEVSKRDDASKKKKAS